MAKLTFSMENYLEAIYELSNGNSGVRVSDISERLGVTKPSVNSAISTLAEKGLVTTEKYKKIYLTPTGLERAKLTSKKHQIIQRFFTEVLKIDADVADQDACSIEHVISGDSIQAMQEYMQATKEK
ncbi:MAG TPA: metal-dependent transcriptional regulator [Hydrogenispora sp.]|jgi:Mn-dependent DtxR family transcriptional regulator|nr:metal-dependent transcriptional regulator [Hydrogenispora sp.]